MTEDEAMDRAATTFNGAIEIAKPGLTLEA
jgi:hypothetical protein